MSSGRHLCSLRFNGIFPGETGLASVYWNKRWWRWWWQLDYWSCKSCKAPVKSSPPTNQQPVLLQARCPSCRPKVSKHQREKYHIPWISLPQAHLGVFQLCLWPLLAPGYLGEGCHASHQPSDASIPRHTYVPRYAYASEVYVVVLHSTWLKFSPITKHSSCWLFDRAQS